MSLGFGRTVVRFYPRLKAAQGSFVFSRRCAVSVETRLVQALEGASPRSCVGGAFGGVTILEHDGRNCGTGWWGEAGCGGGQGAPVVDRSRALSYLHVILLPLQPGPLLRCVRYGYHPLGLAQAPDDGKVPCKQKLRCQSSRTSAIISCARLPKPNHHILRNMAPGQAPTRMRHSSFPQDLQVHSFPIRAGAAAHRCHLVPGFCARITDQTSCLLLGQACVPL